ncbi:MAG: endonuclease III [Planctomycetes bacterium]|nr:endonuclease III [Planctomycetota bacterium]MBI3843816.1 endonuclease III [Planctomycetota bacterium]
MSKMKGATQRPATKGARRLPRESVEARRRRAAEVLARLHEAYPDARCSLDYQSPLQLLIATILSAQCTDARVNQVTPPFFARYPTATSVAGAPREAIESAIRTTGFFRNKAKSIQGACERIVEAYRGDVPRTMDELLTLPGVARKTANVVLGNAFGIACGVVVDTHVQRLAGRIGLSAQKTPEKIEHDLMDLFPKEEWIVSSHLLILHGRKVCQARAPRCAECVINRLCPSAEAPPLPGLDRSSAPR